MHESGKIKDLAEIVNNILLDSAVIKDYATMVTSVEKSTIWTTKPMQATDKTFAQKLLNQETKGDEVKKMNFSAVNKFVYKYIKNKRYQEPPLQNYAEIAAFIKDLKDEKNGNKTYEMKDANRIRDIAENGLKDGYKNLDAFLKKNPKLTVDMQILQEVAQGHKFDLLFSRCKEIYNTAITEKESTFLINSKIKMHTKDIAAAFGSEAIVQKHRFQKDKLLKKVTRRTLKIFNFDEKIQSNQNLFGISAGNSGYLKELANAIKNSSYETNKLKTEIGKNIEEVEQTLAKKCFDQDSIKTITSKIRKKGQTASTEAIKTAIESGNVDYLKSNMTDFLRNESIAKEQRIKAIEDGLQKMHNQNPTIKIYLENVQEHDKDFTDLKGSTKITTSNQDLSHLSSLNNSGLNTCKIKLTNSSCTKTPDTIPHKKQSGSQEIFL